MTAAENAFISSFPEGLPVSGKGAAFYLCPQHSFST
jgi:hypothetical protein